MEFSKIPLNWMVSKNYFYETYIFISYRTTSEQQILFWKVFSQNKLILLCVNFHFQIKKWSTMLQ